MHASTRDSPTLLGRACGAIQLKNPASMVVLGAASYPLSGNVARAQGGGPVGLRQSFFFNAFEIHVSPFKKQLCPLFCNFIDFDFYFFNYYLFCFLKFSFSSISFILLPKNNLYLSSFFFKKCFFFSNSSFDI